MFDKTIERLRSHLAPSSRLRFLFQHLTLRAFARGCTLVCFVATFYPQSAISEDHLEHAAGQHSISFPIVLRERANMINNTDYPGADYDHFVMEVSDALICRNSCEHEPKCRAYTYVRPGVQRDRGVCYLKTKIDRVRQSDCCVSGRKVKLEGFEVLPDDPQPTIDTPTSVAKELGGSVDTPFSQCVNNIEDRFRHGVLGYRRGASGDVEQGHSGRFQFDLSVGVRLPPANQQSTGAGGIHSHVESIVRVPGDRESGWFVMGRLRPSTGAPFYVFEAGNVPKTHGGGRLVTHLPNQDDYYARYESDPERLNRARAYFEIASSKHIGGMQALGNTVAMPVTCDDSDLCTKPSVLFWNFANPIDPKLWSEVELRGVPNVHWAAFNYLESGHALLIVNRADNGNASNFIGERPGPVSPDMKWIEIAPVSMRVPNWDLKMTYQNVNLLRDCGSNELYLAAMRSRGTKPWSTWSSAASLELFRLTAPHDHNAPYGLKFVSEAVFEGRDSEANDDYCEMRGGASVYVSPDGEPIIYCAQNMSEARTVEGVPNPVERLKVSEITSLYEEN